MLLAAMVSVSAFGIGSPPPSKTTTDKTPKAIAQPCGTVGRDGVYSLDGKPYLAIVGGCPFPHTFEAGSDVLRLMGPIYATGRQDVTELSPRAGGFQARFFAEGLSEHTLTAPTFKMVRLSNPILAHSARAIEGMVVNGSSSVPDELVRGAALRWFGEQLPKKRACRVVGNFIEDGATIHSVAKYLLATPPHRCLERAIDLRIEDPAWTHWGSEFVSQWMTDDEKRALAFRLYRLFQKQRDTRFEKSIADRFVTFNAASARRFRELVTDDMRSMATKPYAVPVRDTLHVGFRLLRRLDDDAAQTTAEKFAASAIGCRQRAIAARYLKHQESDSDLLALGQGLLGECTEAEAEGIRVIAGLARSFDQEAAWRALEDLLDETNDIDNINDIHSARRLHIRSGLGMYVCDAAQLRSKRPVAARVFAKLCTMSID
ncbi:MAG: hypothetical protein AAFP04_03450 [Myxococcota bacterium]